MDTSDRLPAEERDRELKQHRIAVVSYLRTIQGYLKSINFLLSVIAVAAVVSAIALVWG